MKKSIHILLLGVFLLLVSGCAQTTTQTPKVDMTLPKVEGIQVISDVDSIAFEWQISKDNRVVGYHIYRAQKGEELKMIAKIDTKYSTHFVDKKLSPNSEYIYQFAAVGEGGVDSARSDVIRTKTLSLEPVTFIKAISNYPKRVKVIWRPHENPRIEGYILERTIGIQNDWKKVADIKSRLFVEYIDRDLEDNMLYRYRVIAIGYGGVQSPPSDMAEAKTKPLPKPVKNVVATVDEPKRILVEWEPNSEESISSYKVYRSSLVRGWYQEIIETQSTKIVDKIDKNGATYFYKVTAIDKDGLEGDMPKDYVIGKTLASPNAPNLISATIISNGIELKWDKGDDRAVSCVVVRKDGLLMGEERAFTGIKDTFFIDKEIETGKKYRYYIYCVDKFNLKSDPSKEAEILIPKN